MFNKARIKQHFNRAARNYDQHASLQRQVAEGLFKAMGAIPAYAPLLDAGAGTGYFQELARKYGHKWTIYQLDVAFSMCAYAQAYASLPEYGHTFTINAECEYLPLAGGSVEGVFSSLMLQWANDIKQAFTEIHRITTKGGYGWFSTLLPNTLRELHTSFEQTGFPSPVSLFHDKEYLVTLLEAVGFRDISTHSETLVQDYGSLLQLMRSLKGVGAQNKMTKENSMFIGKKGLKDIERYYQGHFGSTIPGTWEILYITVRK